MNQSVDTSLLWETGTLDQWSLDRVVRMVGDVEYEVAYLGGELR